MTIPGDAAERAGEILDRLEEAYPEARIELEFGNPLELLVATILSAQCTDKRVNAVTETLFDKYRSARDYAEADRAELEEEIRSTGFFRQKAKSIQGCCESLVEEHDGEVPRSMRELTDLPGVGRKTASVLLAGAFDVPAIAVDTHCRRVSRRLELTLEDGAEKVERDLRELYPEQRWATVSRIFIWHGRYTCKARTPQCSECVVPELCPWFWEQEE